MDETTIGTYLTEMFSLRRKRALVTGSSRGLGLAMAGALAKAGASVVLNSRSRANLETAVAGLRDAGFDAAVSAFDVTDEAAVDKALTEIEGSVGPIDILVNNAGINIRKPLEETDLETWDAVMDTNLKAAFLVSRRVAKGMMARKDGRIVNTCSVLSHAARKTIAPYCAAKAGLKMLTHSMAADWGPYGIRANAIGPGFFKTEMTEPLYTNPDFDAWIREKTTMDRWGVPEELGGAAVFLASDASSYVNGQILYIDGGMLATL